MSAHSSQVIPKPGDHQAFERACLTLFGCMLNDPSPQLRGRSGQSQHGIDILAHRDGDQNKPVGIQCKQKGDGKELTKNEIDKEITEVKKYPHKLLEYYIVTTAPDDTKLQDLCPDLSRDLSDHFGQTVSVHILGWGNLEIKIREYPEAINAFDPDYVSHSEQRFDSLENKLNDLSSAIHVTDQQTSKEIDRHLKAQMTNPESALQNLLELEREISPTASSELRYKIHRSIAACRLELGDKQKAADELIAAYEISPNSPQASTNKALAYLLKGDTDALKTFARPELHERPNNPSLAGLLIESFAEDMEVLNPLSLVPEMVRESPEVLASCSKWTQTRIGPKEAYEHSLAAYERYPDHPTIRENHAYMTLNFVVARYGLENHRDIPQIAKDILTKAYSILLKNWNSLKNAKPGIRLDHARLPASLILMLRLLRRNDEAIDIANTALNIFADSATLKKSAAGLFAEIRDFERASDLISTLEVDEETVMIAFGSAMHDSDWDQVAFLIDEYFNLFPKTEQCIARAARVLADFFRSPYDERQSILNGAQNDPVLAVRGNMMLAHTALQNGYEKLSVEFFQSGSVAFNGENASLADRLAFAQQAMELEKPTQAADLLDGYVSLERDNEGLRIFARACALETPTQQRSVDFFLRIPQDVASQTFYLEQKNIFELNQKHYEEAKKTTLQLIEREPCSEYVIHLIIALHNLQNNLELKQYLKNTDIDKWPGHPLSRIQIAQALAQNGFIERACDVAYLALCDGIENPDVVSRFISLFLINKIAGNLTDLTVSPGMWVQFTSEGEHPIEMIVDEKSDRRWGAAWSDSHSFLLPALNLKIGDTFQKNYPSGSAKIWRVADIKPRWLRAFEFASKQFSVWFPESNDFWTLNIKDDDFEPFLAALRSRWAYAEKMIEFYSSNDIPLALAAQMTGGHALQLASTIAHSGRLVRTCIGTRDERTAAWKAIKDHSANGVVIDGFTAWRAAELGILPVLKELFVQVVIPENELHDLEEFCRKQDYSSSHRNGETGYDGIHYFFHEPTVEDRRKQSEYLNGNLSLIKHYCTKKPSIVPPKHNKNDILQIPNAELFSPAYIAEEGQLLLSDDTRLRRIAHQIFGTEGVWLQPVLQTARNKGIIDHDRYTDALVGLAERRHDFVTLHAADLISAFHRDEYPSFSRLRVLLFFLGREDADLYSHAQVTLEFLQCLWSNFLDLKIYRATSILMWNFIGRSPQWATRAAILHRGIELAIKKEIINPELLSHLNDWIRGHFFSMKEIDDEIKARWKSKN